MAAGCEGNSAPEAAGCDPFLRQRLTDAVVVELVDVRWSRGTLPGSENGSPAPRITVTHSAGGCRMRPKSLPQAAQYRQNPCQNVASTLVAVLRAGGGGRWGIAVQFCGRGELQAGRQAGRQAEVSSAVCWLGVGV